MSEVFKLDPEQLISKYLDSEKLNRYYELLMEQNRMVNLVSRETLRPDFDRMVAESLLPLEYLDRKSDSYLDIGSGGGLPSIPLLLAGIGSIQTGLVERTGKKARALGEIVTGLTLTAKVYSQTFEELDHCRYGMVTLRYVKLTARLLSSIMSALKTGGVFVYYSTPDFKTPKLSATTVTFYSGQPAVTKSFTIFKK